MRITWKKAREISIGVIKSAEKSRRQKPKRHRHKLWAYGGAQGAGCLLWCYQCGAVMNCDPRAEKWKWVKPTGPGGHNPAMKET